MPKKFHVIIIGCQMNYSDADRLMALMESRGCQKTAIESEADVIFIVACSVRQKAMDRIYGRLNRWQAWRKKRGVKMILTGCVLPYDRKKLLSRFDLILPIKDLASLPAQLGLAKKKKWAITNADYLAMPHSPANSFQAFVPIMTGCNNYCTFCAVPYTRGEEASRPMTDIVKEVTALVNAGFKEITLLGQNVNAYINPEKYHTAAIRKIRSRDFWAFHPDEPIQWRTATTKVPKDFTELLKKIDEIPGDFWIRFLTSNPQDVSPELISTLPKLKKMTPYFHLPIQAGDDEILHRMNRRHTRAYYLDLIKKIRHAWPAAAITTDIIVGFPGETRKQFLQTASLMRVAQYDMAYLAEYSPRPGTASARFFRDDVPKKEKTRRKEYLNAILTKTALRNNKKYVGQTVKALVDRYDEKNKIDSGKTGAFKTIHFPGPNLTGEFIDVTVKKADAWGLTGE
ncbi:MAG: MiaB/RimO family radical SAM methylthiotransferase [Patescibacteria group bacterium]